jgi:hypothetical protein
MCIFSTRWFLSCFSKKEKISEQEIQLRRIKSLPFYWQLSQKNKLV